MVSGMAGIRTTSMYLTAEELGKGQQSNTRWVLSGCLLYSILCSCCISGILYFFAPQIAAYWIRDFRTVESLQIYASIVPIICLCGVMTGYFTASNRIWILAIIEVAEQLCSMFVTVIAIRCWAGSDAVRACQCILLGSGSGACLTLTCLSLLRIRERTDRGKPIAIARRLTQTAVPLAMADVLKSGINTAENLMVPRRLQLNTSIPDPLAAFGLVSGMVFPILMFPASIIYALAELLIPELARCNASGSTLRISYLVRRTLKATMVYGLFFSGLMFLLAEPLCLKFYKSADAVQQLRLYALLIPMLYCDAVTDAMTKGLGQQKTCVQYNIITSVLDLIFLFVLLPGYGMKGYFVSFLLTHLINFTLSLRRLLKISHTQFSVRIPVSAFIAAIAAAAGASVLRSSISKTASYIALLGSLFVLLHVIGYEDSRWFSGLLKQKE